MSKIVRDQLFHRLADVPSLNYRSRPDVKVDVMPDWRQSADLTDFQSIISRTYEALEFPGMPRDYHEILRHGYESLQKPSRHDPVLLLEMERLCWIDISLVNVCPDVAFPEGVKKFQADGYAQIIISAFAILIQLYAYEGFLYEAQRIALMGAKYGQCPYVREKLEERIIRLEEENEF